MLTTNSTARAEFISGLRRLADFLAARPRLPVPVFGADIIATVEGTPAQRRATVDRLAALLGVEASEGLAYAAVRDFGPISFQIVAPIEDAEACAAGAEALR